MLPARRVSLPATSLLCHLPAASCTPSRTPPSMLLKPTPAVAAATAPQPPRLLPPTRAELASAVLQHVACATPVTANKRSSRGSTSSTSTSTTSTTSSSTSTSSSSWLDLQPFITMLPCPPAPAVWRDLCGDLVLSGRGAALERWVTSEREELPDVQGSAAARCQLARQPWAWRFKDPRLSAFVAALFFSVASGRTTASWKRLGAQPPRLCRFDLWHGHFFLARPTSSSSRSSRPPTRRRRRTAHQAPSVGILFHAAEFPAYDSGAFAIDLGNCQLCSTLPYNQRAMELRNILWWQGNLAVLDVGASSPLHALLHEGSEPVCTLYEEDWGKPLADVLLLQQHPRRRRSLRAAQQQAQRHWQRLQTAGEARAPFGVFVSY